MTSARMTFLQPSPLWFRSMLTFLLKVSQLTGDEGVKQKLGASNNLHKFDMEKSDKKGDIVIFAQINQVFKRRGTLK